LGIYVIWLGETLVKCVLYVAGGIRRSVLAGTGVACHFGEFSLHMTVIIDTRYVLAVTTDKFAIA
jgi:hypothetical protein